MVKHYASRKPGQVLTGGVGTWFMMSAVEHVTESRYPRTNTSLSPKYHFLQEERLSYLLNPNLKGESSRDVTHNDSPCLTGGGRQSELVFVL